ncbi:MAG: M15 family peptidase [Pseudomonadota bacterium]
MDLKHIQRALKAADWYAGDIDGIDGPLTSMALVRAETAFRQHFTRDPAQMTREHRLVAGAQAALLKLGHAPGAIDGYAGHNTHEAMADFLHVADKESKRIVRRGPLAGRPSPANLPRQAECPDVYGVAGSPELEAQLVLATPAYPLLADWALDVPIRGMRVHQLVAPSLEAATGDVLKHYGLKEIQSLGLDRYAGGYVNRPMRGGSNPSMHAYGAATDWYAAPNSLRTRCPDALFCGAEYQAFLDIMESHGWLPAVRLWGADAMHFQAARL